MSKNDIDIGRDGRWNGQSSFFRSVFPEKTGGGMVGGGDEWMARRSQRVASRRNRISVGGPEPSHSDANEDEMDPYILAAVNQAVSNLLPSIVAQVVEAAQQNSTGGPPPKPQSFISAPTPVDAENWVSHIQKIFEVLGCSEPYRVKLAVYKLEGDAQRWWDAIKQAKGNEYVDALSWMGSREVFYQQYFSAADKNTFVREYATIRQRDDESVTEYLAADAVKNIEMERQDFLASKPDGGKNRSRDGQQIQQMGQQNQQQGGNSGNQWGHNSGKRQGQWQGQNQGQRRHPGNVCYKASGACFLCDQVGHLARDCKKSCSTDKGNDAKATSGGRVFALSANQAANSVMISRILSIGTHDVYALIDTGATHSMVSLIFANHLRVPCTSLESPLVIATPLGNSVVISREFKGCPLKVGGQIREVDLLPISMNDFDVILGMDWLSKHRETIECLAKQVIFGDKERPDFVYQGFQPKREVKIISALKAQKLVFHGCQGFLALVKDTSVEEHSLESQPVVR
ncbi:uncharacterized protein LOC112523863 [Cynara cardunculus var. scolymus]|uniref:uncharacterized protein LOC112523863 n=1 Tax=Cynara cardunculus var. scolymus TaxID=59895 RepID=UPI000D624BD2|nr:uncharacterized protein LOC112523863 [Cynara cardunculus var. scolymus]